VHIDTLVSYSNMRKLCEGKRYATIGRRLDNYTVMVLRHRGTNKECIDITHKAWNKDREGLKPEEVKAKKIPAYVPAENVMASVTPDDLVKIPSVTRFSSHQLGMLFRLWTNRDKKKYLYVHDQHHTRFLADHPVTCRLERTGCRLLEGNPVPRITKDDAASLEWLRAYRTFEKSFRCAVIVGAYDEVIHDRGHPWRSGWKPHSEEQVAQFVELVKSCDVEGMVKHLAPNFGRHTTDAQSALAFLKLHYTRNRRDILIASGARVKAK